MISNCMRTDLVISKENGKYSIEVFENDKDGAGTLFAKLSNAGIEALIMKRVDFDSHTNKGAGNKLELILEQEEEQEKPEPSKKRAKNK